ncbi:TetR/AcrR family transcriptional regulator [Microbispora siamensis]
MTPSGPEPAPPGRTRRADASRNAALLLAAARELIDSSGPDVALDEVARRAGVGNATLHRHFPTRAELLVAVYADEVAELCRQGADLLAVRVGPAGAAQAAGAVRPGLTVTDLLALVGGAALTGTDVAHARRLTALLRGGLETGA